MAGSNRSCPVVPKKKNLRQPFIFIYLFCIFCIFSNKRATEFSLTRPRQVKLDDRNRSDAVGTLQQGCNGCMTAASHFFVFLFFFFPQSGPTRKTLTLGAWQLRDITHADKEASGPVNPRLLAETVGGSQRARGGGHSASPRTGNRYAPQAPTTTTAHLHSHLFFFWSRASLKTHLAAAARSLI